MEEQISKIQLFDIAQHQDGIQLSVTSEATLLLSKYKHNNILPICCVKSQTQQVLSLLMKNRANNFVQLAEQTKGQCFIISQSKIQEQIYIIDKPITLKNDSLLIVFEIPDNVAFIDPKDGRNSLQYIYLSFALYISQYTLLGHLKQHNLFQYIILDEINQLNLQKQFNCSKHNEQMMELSILEIKRDFIQSLKTLESEQNDQYSRLVADLSQLKSVLNFEPRYISGNPVKGEITLYMTYEFQQSYSQNKTIDINQTFESHSLIYFKKIKDELYTLFLTKVYQQEQQLQL